MKIKNSSSYHNNNNNNKRKDDISYSRLKHHTLFDHKYYNGIGKIGQHEIIKIEQQVRTAILNRTIHQQRLTSNIQWKISVWLPTLPSVYNFTPLNSRR